MQVFGLNAWLEMLVAPNSFRFVRSITAPRPLAMFWLTRLLALSLLVSVMLVAGCHSEATEAGLYDHAIGEQLHEQLNEMGQCSREGPYFVYDLSTEWNLASLLEALGVDITRCQVEFCHIVSGTEQGFVPGYGYWKFRCSRGVLLALNHRKGWGSIDQVSLWILDEENLDNNIQSENIPAIFYSVLDAPFGSEKDFEAFRSDSRVR